MQVIFRKLYKKIFSETPAFWTKSTWNPPSCHPALKMFHSKVEGDTFPVLPGTVSSCICTKNESFAIRGLTEDHSIVIKSAANGWIGRIARLKQKTILPGSISER